jgi:hypothetical protein
MKKSLLLSEDIHVNHIEKLHAKCFFLIYLAFSLVFESFPIDKNNYLESFHAKKIKL